MSYSKNKNGNKYRFSVSSDSDNNRRKSFKISATPTREQWAEQVVQHFLNVNNHLSTLDRLDEWSVTGEDYSKTWSDDGDTITPWRFQGMITPNMIPMEDWQPQDKWGNDDSGNLVDADGYYIPDVNGSNGTELQNNPRRMWGNNTPEMDKLFHRLYGIHEKYSTIHAQYSEYEYDEPNKKFKKTTSAFPVDEDGNEVSEEISKSIVKNYYWNTFGYEGGLGNNTSNWLYPVFAGEDSQYSDGFEMDVQRTTDNNNRSYFDISGGNRHDCEGSIISDSIAYFFPKNLVGYTSGDSDIYRSTYTGDRLIITTSYARIQNPSFRIRAAQSGDRRIYRNFYTDCIFVKSFSYYELRDHARNFPLPSLRGNFTLSLGGSITTGWKNTQESVPLSRANILLGQTGTTALYTPLPATFKNITTRIGINTNSIDSTRPPVFQCKLKNCPTLEHLGYIKSDILRVKGNCDKLKTIQIGFRGISSVNVDNLQPNTFDIHTEILDGETVALNIHAGIVKTLEVMNCKLTSVQCDAIIRALVNAADEATEPYENGVLRLDNYRQQTGGQWDSNAANEAPSDQMINYADNSVITDSPLYKLINTHNWTVSWRDPNWPTT